MKFELLTFEIPKKSWAWNVISVYEKKLQPFVSFRIRFLKTSALARKNQMEARRLASEILGEALDTQAFIVCFDERGAQLKSPDFAKRIGRALESGKQKVQFVIGGPYGVDERIRERATACISLSPLVMNQEVALTVAMEQIYRSFTIRNHLPYHNL